MASIKEKPDKTIEKLKVNRDKSGSYKINATWKVPKAMINSDSKSRATDLDIVWTLGLDNGKKKDPKKVIHKTNEESEKHSINLDNLTIKKKKGDVKYTRESFYPLKKKPKLEYVSCSVTPTNSKGSGKKVTEQVKFGLPKEPTIDAFTFNNDNGAVSTTIRTDAGTGKRERYDTFYYVEVYNTRTGKRTIITPSDQRTTKSTAKAVSYNVSDYQQLSYDQYVAVIVKATARGLAGPSEQVSKTYYVGYPSRVNIKSANTTGKTSTDKCTVLIDVGSSNAHPVDAVRLEYLADCDYAKAEDIPASESWTETNIIDDAKCSALSIPVPNVMPSRGKHTWVRVKSWHANEDVLYRYSNYVEITDLYEESATATDDKIDIIGTEAGADGKSVIVHLGWNKTGADDSTGTELTWSDEEDSWRSTNPPDQFTFAWSDGQVTHESTTYLDSATITIKDLNEATKYYVKARRYLDDGETVTYSQYAEGTQSTTETPEVVVATAERYVPAGMPLAVRWTFSGYSLQKSWRIITDGDDEYALTQDLSVVSEKEYYSRSGAGTSASPYVYEIVANPDDSGLSTYYELIKQNGITLAGGDGSFGYGEIDAQKLLSVAKSNNVTFRVEVSTGGRPVVSEPHTVTIVENPVLAITASNKLEVQPLTFSATVTELSDLIVIITSNGIAGQTPQGNRRQASGDTIYSDVVSPEWTENNGIFSANIDVPSGLGFIDTGDYTISVVAIDRTTGLKSTEQTAEFEIDWEHKAPNPDGFVTLNVVDQVDSDGDHVQAVEINLSPPDDCYFLSEDTEVDEDKNYFAYNDVTETYSQVTPQSWDNPSNEGWYELYDDTYDIYRMDVEKPVLISGEGYPLQYTAIDYFSPFGDSITLYYRIACRTADGDTDFADIEYTAQCENIRFDWSGGSLELPYGIAMAEKFTKDVAIRKHMDGSSDGFWNLNVERKASLHSDVIKIIQPKDIERTRLLARHTGPVFVRLPNGSAYEADVQVSDLSKKNEAGVSVAFDATEIGLTTEFSLPVPYVAPEEENEEE